MAIPWTSEQTESLRRKVVDERKPSNIVAAELSREWGYRVSRNAVMGRADRLGLRFAGARRKRPPVPVPAVMDIGEFQCRWIEHGEFCARPTLHAKSWCEEHRRRVWLGK